LSGGAVVYVHVPHIAGATIVHVPLLQLALATQYAPFGKRQNGVVTLALHSRPPGQSSGDAVQVAHVPCLQKPCPH
jgi:hypothetical protein